MLPDDIRRLILEFHDEFGIWKLRMHTNLVIKSAFRACQHTNAFDRELFGNLGIDYSYAREVEWHNLMCYMQVYDRQMQRIKEYSLPIYRLWASIEPGLTVVPWD